MDTKKSFIGILIIISLFFIIFLWWYTSNSAHKVTLEQLQIQKNNAVSDKEKLITEMKILQIENKLHSAKDIAIGSITPIILSAAILTSLQ